MKSISLLAVFILLGQSAVACRDPLSETKTFFAELPPSLKSKNVIAKIKILSLPKNTTKEKITKAKVISAIKGIKDGVLIQIASDLSSCNRDPEIRIDDEYFIAGALDANGFFRGVWREREIVSHK